MEEEIKRACPVCGSTIVGRIDKVFCCNDCRSYYHNSKYRDRRRTLEGNGDWERLTGNVLLLMENKSSILLKFIVFLSGICKILSIFEASILKGERYRAI